MPRIWQKIRMLWDTPARWPFVVATLLLIVAALANTVSLERIRETLELWLASQLDWGVIGFIVACTVLMAFAIPEVVLGVIAGNILGFVWGSLSFCIAGLLCSLLVFLITRRFLQARVQSMLVSYPKLRAIEGIVNDGGLSLLCLLRLLPVNPALMSYALATTKVRLRSYLLANFCMLPGWVLTVYFGHVATNVVKVAGGINQYAPLRDTLTIAGLALAVVAIVYTTRLALKQCALADTSE